MILVHKIGSHYAHGADFHLTREKGSGDWLALLTETAAGFWTEEGWRSCPAHTLIIYRRGTRQDYRAVGKSFVNDWFHFEPLEGEGYFAGLGLPLDQPVPLKDWGPLADLVQRMVSEDLSGRPNRSEILSRYAEIFFLTAAGLIQSPDPARGKAHYPILSDIREELRSSPARRWTVGELAARSGLSPDYFQHLYREYFGVPCMTDLIHARIDYSCYLLKTTDLPVRRVAELCGYENETHFMRQFKKFMGLTPGQYRR